MSDRQEPFEGDNPFEIAASWLAEASKLEISDPTAMALATVDQHGLPNVRMVLLKEVEADSFLFYTNYHSAKASELATGNCAAFVIHWKSLRRQIRARGAVEKEDGRKADRYFRSRPLESRWGAWASRQSKVISSRDDLLARFERKKKLLGDDPARPEFWGGYRLTPVEMEFWCEGDFRLHNRFQWTRVPGGSWNIDRLAP